MADVWAFGVLLYLLMYGHYPYDAKHPRDIMVKILTEPIKWESKARLSKEAIDFLNKLLEHNLKKRLTAEGALGHPWMSKATAAAESEEGPALNPEVVRSAQKKVTGTKKMIAPQVEKLRNEKLQKIDEDFNKGIRHGKRLGETPKEDYMGKPEFLRRENKITSAPSHQLVSIARRLSLSGIRSAFGGGTSRQASPQKNDAIQEEDEDEDDDDKGEETDKVANIDAKHEVRQNPARMKGRSQSLSEPANPRRLSYLPGITSQDEQTFASSFAQLLRDKKEFLDKGSLPFSAVMPEPDSPKANVEVKAADIPGLSPEKTDDSKDTP